MLPQGGMGEQLIEPVRNSIMIKIKYCILNPSYSHFCKVFHTCQSPKIFHISIQHLFGENSFQRSFDSNTKLRKPV